MTSLRTRWAPERVIAEFQTLASGPEPVRWSRLRSILKNMAIKYFGSMAAARAA